MNKRGFTLIELLAVIIILGILMLIAVPSVTGYINNSRKNAYVGTIHNAIDSAVAKVNTGDFEVQDPDTTYYIHLDNLEMENGKVRSPYGEIEDAYVVVTYDGDGYDYYYVGKDAESKGINRITLSSELDADDIGQVETVSTAIGVGSRSKIVVYDKDGAVSTPEKTGSVPEAGNKGLSSSINNCTYDGNLVQGAELVVGQYTYRYKQDNMYGNWRNMDDDGWGVILTDKESTEPVTSKICTSINNKPIVSMNSLFYQSKTTSIDLSSFNTRNVTKMVGMFRGCSNLTSLDITPLNTSKVTDMTYMFQGCSKLTSLNFRNFDTSSVTFMPEVFAGCSSLTTLDVSNFDVSKVTGIFSLFNGCSSIKRLYMDNWDISSASNRFGDSMFSNMTSLEYISMKNWKIGNEAPPLGYGWGTAGLRNLKTVDVSGWDLSGTTSLLAVFQSMESVENIIGLNTWNFSNITSIAQMFLLCKKLQVVDFSEVDLSHVTETTDMFDRCNSLTVGYAKNQADADKLNASTKKPEGLVFTVK